MPYEVDRRFGGNDAADILMTMPESERDALGWESDTGEESDEESDTGEIV